MATKSLASLLHEYCCQCRSNWSVAYTDINPTGHASDLESLRQLTTSEQRTAHPLYKTRLCTSSPCPRGDACPYAHDPSDLRPVPTDFAAPEYLFALILERPGQPPLEFCNLDAHPQKSEAKADLAAQCIRELHLKVDVARQQLVDDDSWTVVGAHVVASRQPSTTTPGTPVETARPPIPPWQKRQLLEVVGRINETEAVRAAALHGYERWVACIGGTFGSSEPRLAAAMRMHYGRFKEFVTVHAGQIRHPRPPPTSSAEQDEETDLSSFYDTICSWISMRGGRVSAADIGQFYTECPHLASAFRGKWKPSQHCERDGRLRWLPNEMAPGAGWIELLTNSTPASGATSENMAAVDQSRDDAVASLGTDRTIEWLTSSRKSGALYPSMTDLDEATVFATLGPAHPALLAIIRAAGDTGLELAALKVQIELGLRLRKSVKTARLAAYVKALPMAFRVQETTTTTGELRHTVVFTSVENSGPPDDATAWQHASRFTANPSREAASSTSSLDAWWEFLDSQGIDVQTARMMSVAELVELGVSSAAADRLLAAARLLGGNDASSEDDRNVYADYEQCEAERNTGVWNGNQLTSREAELQQQVAELQLNQKELLQRCSDLQLRVSVLEEARMCNICMERKRDTVIMPCMHAMFCSVCLRGQQPVTSCPTCRGRIAGLVECRFDMVDEEQTFFLD